RIPCEVRFIAGKQEELLPQRVMRERELESGGAVLREMILLEDDDRSPCSVVEERIVVEDDDGLRVGDGVQVIDEARDGAACVGETCEENHQWQPRGDSRGIHYSFVQVCGCGHTSMLEAPSARRARSVMLTANRPGVRMAPGA